MENKQIPRNGCLSASVCYVTLCVLMTATPLLARAQIKQTMLLMLCQRTASWSWFQVKPRPVGDRHYCLMTR